MKLNYKTLKKLNSKGFFDLVIALLFLGYWCYWMLEEVLLLSLETAYLSMLSASFLSVAIGHAVRAYYLNLLLKKSENESNRNLRVLRDVRKTLNKVTNSSASATTEKTTDA